MLAFESNIFYTMEPQEIFELIKNAEKKGTINVFNFKKAARLIKDNELLNVDWGIYGDWDGTVTPCIRDSQIVYDYKDETTIHSKWGTPALYDLDNDTFYFTYYTVDYDKNIDYRGFWDDDELNNLRLGGF